MDIARGHVTHRHRSEDLAILARRAVLLKAIKRFGANESGATAIEYALIASLIAVFIIGSLQVLGANMSSVYSEVSANLK